MEKLVPSGVNLVESIQVSRALLIKRMKQIHLLQRLEVKSMGPLGGRFQIPLDGFRHLNIIYKMLQWLKCALHCRLSFTQQSSDEVMMYFQTKKGESHLKWPQKMT